MTPEEFVSVVQLVVEKRGIEDMVTTLSEMKVKYSNSRQKYLASWYQDLDEEGKECVSQIIRETASTIMFGFFCVLDGVRTIENGTDKGELQLYHVRNNKKSLLNDFNEEFLHDIYKSLENQG